jgi:hypothetical protein
VASANGIITRAATIAVTQGGPPDGGHARGSTRGLRQTVVPKRVRQEGSPTGDPKGVTQVCSNRGFRQGGSLRGSHKRGPQ